MKTLQSIVDSYIYQHHGTQNGAAMSMGITHNQLNRWLKLQALVNDDGDVFIKSKATISLSI